MHRARVYLAVFGFAGVLFVPGVSSAAAQENEPHYVGAQACQKCHAEEWDAYQVNPHHLAEID